MSCCVVLPVQLHLVCHIIKKSYITQCISIKCFGLAPISDINNNKTNNKLLSHCSVGLGCTGDNSQTYQVAQSRATHFVYELR